MTDQLKEKANEISLMLVMSSDSDSAGHSLVLELCAELAKLAGDGHKRLVEGASYLQAQTGAKNLFDLLQSYASAAVKYLEGDSSVQFPHEQKQGSDTSSPDMAASIDPAFLAEFIETHNLMLEDFESLLLDSQTNGGSPEKITSSVKAYLHNLKGDAGSIGLPGIERVAHHLEDTLEKSPANQNILQLMAFKAWVSQCLQCFARGEKPQEAADAFWVRIQGAGTNTEAGSAQTKPQIEASRAVTANVATTQVESSEYVLTGERDILLEFAAEAEEHLSNVESVILESEGSYSKDAIDTIFRGVHSIKGGSAYFSIEEMTKCSHILENYLSEVRDGKREMDQELSKLLLTYIDLQKEVLTRARAAATNDGKLVRAQNSIDFLNALHVYGGAAEVTKTQVVSPSKQAVVEQKAAPVATEASEAKGDKLNVKNFVKVDTSRLDLLIDSIGEMVIYSSMLIRHCRELLHDNESVMDATHRVEKFARDLQDIGMSMRLVPIKGLFQKMSRLVWDTSKKIGKDIVFDMEGEDTELDRNLIDKLADPLMHMVRNAIDHGIETPEEREKKGKPRTGTVKLSAFHAGGSIHIKLQDDGKGLNPEKLVAKAIEKGIIAEGQKLSEQETFALIFAAGFSTAAVVTDISGRGVGMDVVRRNVESLRGRIHIESKIDRGTTFTIELPLTLAILDGIQVQVGSESLIIPSLAIVEFVRPTEKMISTTLDHGETFHFRGKYLPVYRIADLYDLKAKHDRAVDATIVVVECNQEHVALMVDDILGECSTVIKSLGSIFEEGRGFAGCAIMPKGNVALILDIRSLIQYARKEYRPVPRSVREAHPVHVH